MKVRFNRQEMADVLSVVCSVAASRTPKPVLQCVHLKAASDALLLSATDLELSLRCAVTQVEVNESDSVLVLADTLAKIVRECADDTLELSTEESTMHVRGSGSHFQIVTQDAADFPPIPVLEGEPDFTMESGLLRRLIEWTVFAAARESSRYAINGVLWEVEAEKLTMVATDGRRLACAVGALASAAAKTARSAIVPGKALSLIKGLPLEADAQVGIKITDNQLLLHAGGSMISTSLIEGRFPRYQDVIPTDLDREVRLSTAEFQSALKRAALLTNEESKGVRLSFAEGCLTLSSRAPEQGEATISMPIEYKGETLEIGFNPVFLLEILRVAHTDEITFSFREASRPGMVKVKDDLIHVVMPVDLSSG